jgi:diguanylate cyclase (GGDEF)-like protein
MLMSLIWSASCYCFLIYWQLPFTYHRLWPLYAHALEKHLSQAIAQQRPFSIIMLDVDYFKRYNDHYGHQAGDACLAAVAVILRESVRTPEDVVARYGGEEFVVMLLDANLAQAEAVPGVLSNICNSERWRMRLQRWQPM